MSKMLLQRRTGLSPSIICGLLVIVVELMAAGLPVVVSDWDSYRVLFKTAAIAFVLDRVGRRSLHLFL